MKDTTAEHIYNILFLQKFADFYNGDFEKHLTADENCKTKEEILEQIKIIFNRIETE